MAPYSPPLREIRFVLEHVCDYGALTKLEGFGHADLDTAMAVLEEWGRFATDILEPINAVGDRQHSKVVDGSVVTPDGFKDAYAQYVAAGWGAVPFEPGYGGGGFPWTVAIAQQEMFNSCNTAFALCPLLTQGAIDAFEVWGDEIQRQTYLSKMISGEWTGTMNLTEPDAGSDVGALRTKAVPADDVPGAWRISGTKIFITYGDHDMAENIVHLVLARTLGSPPGTKGISLFVVPKRLVNDDGSLGARNAANVVSIEHKMGICGSPTCVMEYDGALGWLLGPEHAGMKAMFTMMNNARLSVGVEGLGLAEAAYQRAAAYAKERKQGRSPGASGPGPAAIVEHPDVRRTLLTMRSQIEALRALAYVEAEHVDLARHHPDEGVRAAAREVVDLYTPLVKAWGTDLGCELTSHAIQVHGGVGYIEETGIAQFFRDARITPIYEGTNGIQALDLVFRKISLRGGAVLAETLRRVDATAADLAGTGDVGLISMGKRLTAAVATVEDAVTYLGAADQVDAMSGATPFLRMLATTVGGWMAARGALAAHRLLVRGASGEERTFYETKIVTARFFAEHVLPQTHGLLPTVTAGKDLLMELPAASF